MFKIGIISDTHSLLRPEAERRLMGVDHIVHASDVGRPEIVDALRRIAPVTAIRGNVDSGEWARARRGPAKAGKAQWERCASVATGGRGRSSTLAQSGAPSLA
jgi:predicted phosphodiesterase